LLGNLPKIFLRGARGAAELFMDDQGAEANGSTQVPQLSSELATKPFNSLNGFEN